MEYIVHRGVKIPLIGLGTYRLEEYENHAEMKLAVQTAIHSLGMTLLDTAEMYGNGESEKAVGEIIQNTARENLFIVSKILPENARKGIYAASCRKSLDMLQTDYIDLYLLHWKGGVDLQEMVNQMERLVALGWIKHWGVSNFDVADMEELFACKNANKCFCNQVLYNVCDRGPEYDLVPWCKAHDVLLIAYSPLCHKAVYREAVTTNETWRNIAQDEQKTPESLMLSFVIRNREFITVFKSAQTEHILNNMHGVFQPISQQGLERIEQLFAAPVKKIPLKKI